MMWQCASIRKGAAWFETDWVSQHSLKLIVYLTLNKSVSSGKIVSFIYQTLSDCSYTRVQRGSAHSEHKLDSFVIDEFTTNDELLSPSLLMNKQEKEDNR